MRSYAFLVAILIGIFIPEAHYFTFLIKYNLFVMLFYAFLNMEVNRDMLNFSHLRVLIANIIIPLLVFLLLRPVDLRLAMAGFVIAITPTAAAAPVITGFLRARVAFVTTSVLITSTMVAFLIPLLLPRMVDVHQQLTVLKVLQPVAILIFIPLLIGQLIHKKAPELHHWLNKGKDIPFYLFVVNVFIASAKSSDFIQHDAGSEPMIIVQIGLLTLIICVLNFGIGHWLSKDQYPLEASMSLGRKNTMFAIWLALTFVTPLAALGPMFYILFQNMYNSYQIIKLET